jgi:hypothetical protein
MPLLFRSLPIIVFNGVGGIYFGGERGSMRLVQQKAVRPVPQRNSWRLKQVPFQVRRG